MSRKKKILVLDIWRGTQGGASKSALYGELSKLYSLEFPVFRQPLLYKAWKYLASFHPDLTKWKQRKAVIDERSQKYPKTFRMATVAWNEAIGKMPKDYDALLQSIPGCLIFHITIPLSRTMTRSGANGCRGISTG